MEDFEELRSIFEQDCYEFEDEWDPHDQWSLLREYERKSYYDPITGEEVKEKFIAADEVSGARTIITSGSEESETSVETESSESGESTAVVSKSKKGSLTDSILSLSNLPINYPVVEFLHLKEAFWILYPNPPVYESDGVDKFFDYVKILELAPISSLKEQLKSDRVILKYYGIDPGVVKVLSQALLFNHTVKILDLQENILTPSACQHLNKLLLRSHVLSSLNLTACQIGLEGAIKLADGIALSSALKELNLSRCNLRNEGFYYIAKSVAANTLIKKLDISDNNLNEQSALFLLKILTSTESLDYLNLSWNDFYKKQAIEQIFGGLSRNSSLVELKMSWNAMGKYGVFYIRNFIQHTKKLKYLDLSGNRFGDSEAQQIASGVSKNRSLLEFQFSKNPLRSEAVAGFIKTLADDGFIYKSPLKLLDLSSYWSAKSGLPAIEQLKLTKPTLVIKLSGILENFTIVGPDLRELWFKTANYDAMSCKNKKERRNFGHFVLSLSDSKISKVKFQDRIEQAKIPISENLVKEIIKQFLVTKKTLDQGALKESYMSYFPDTKLPKSKDAVSKAASKKTTKSKKSKKGKKSGSKKKKKGKKK